MAHYTALEVKINFSILQIHQLAMQSKQNKCNLNGTSRVVCIIIEWNAPPSVEVCREQPVNNLVQFLHLHSSPLTHLWFFSHLRSANIKCKLMKCQMCYVYFSLSFFRKEVLCLRVNKDFFLQKDYLLHSTPTWSKLRLIMTCTSLLCQFLANPILNGKVFEGRSPSNGNFIFDYSTLRSRRWKIGTLNPFRKRISFVLRKHIPHVRTKSYKVYNDEHD